MEVWDESINGPKGKFRVVGTDLFSWLHDDYRVRDCAVLATAKQLANSHVQAMTSAADYDVNGGWLFRASIDSPKA